MPLEVLGPLVALGIALVVLLVRGLGLSHPLRFETEDAAREAYLGDFPEDAEAARRAEIFRTDDDAAALIPLPGALGVAAAFGDGAVARRLPEGTARARATAEGLKLLSDDFGAPAIRLRLARSADRATAAAIVRRYGSVEDG